MAGDTPELAWPLTRLNEALEALARRAGLSPRARSIPAAPEVLGSNHEALEDWIEAAASWLGVEAEPAASSYPEVEHSLNRAAPGLVRLDGDGQPEFLALLGSKRKSILILRSDLTTVKVRPDVLRDLLCGALERAVAPEVDRLLAHAGVSGERLEQARGALVSERLRNRQIGGWWLLRFPPGSPIGPRLRQARLGRQLLALAGSHAAEYGLWILSWWMVGSAALEGRFDYGLLLGWALLLLTLVPFRLLTTWLQGTTAVGGGLILKQRLLSGALRLESEEIRHQGAGQFLAQVIESEAVESLALSGGFLAGVAAIELLAALVILDLGAGGRTESVLLAVWIAVTLVVVWRYFGRRNRWACERLAMTHDVVERMAGHRTRLAQEPREHWHEDEDRMLTGYLELSARMDKAALPASALVPRGWLVLAFMGLTPSFVGGDASAASLAVAVGGILFAHRALRRLTQGLANLADAGICWRRVAPLFRAAARPACVGSPAFSVPLAPRTRTRATCNGRKDSAAEAVSRTAGPAPAAERSARSGQICHREFIAADEGSVLQVCATPGVDASSPSSPQSDTGQLIEARELLFGYGGRGQPVLRGCSVAVDEGDRLLLEGPSGGGKSTLASLLAGLRLPQSGLLLLDGLDRQTLGEDGWRRRVVSAPQFHENHVLTETFAFNLLMGRRWPPSEEDLREAETVCWELGLGELLRRMPASLLQMVGEMGWQLSHGERSRLFIARALLQRTRLIVLDESFAALDPESLQRVMRCVLARSSTLLVIAHP